VIFAYLILIIKLIFSKFEIILLFMMLSLKESGKTASISKRFETNFSRKITKLHDESERKSK